MDHDQPRHISALRETIPANSRADAVVAFFAIVIAVCGVLFFISQQ
jgi:hypothetical protein